MDQELLVRVWQMSDEPIPEYIFKLAAHLQAQPNIVRFWCFPCLKSLTTTSNKPPVGTLESFAKVMFEGVADVAYCSRKGTNYGICNGCQGSKKGGCTEVPPPLRRAVNVFQYLLQSALRHHAARRTALGDAYTFEDVLEEGPAKARWTRAWDYVKKLADAQDQYRKDENRARGKMGEVDWEKARQVSREHQLERYKLGMGPSGRAAPANIVVDPIAEQPFLKEGTARNCEKRGYYYGDVPSARDSAAPFPSPTKQGMGKGKAKAYRQDSDEDMGDYRPSPGSFD